MARSSLGDLGTQGQGWGVGGAKRTLTSSGFHLTTDGPNTDPHPKQTNELCKDRQGHTSHILEQNYSCSRLCAWRRPRLMWSLMQSVCAAARSAKAHSVPADSLFWCLFFLISCLIFVNKTVSLKTCLKHITIKHRTER